VMRTRVVSWRPGATVFRACSADIETRIRPGATVFRACSADIETRTWIRNRKKRASVHVRFYERVRNRKKRASVHSRQNLCERSRGSRGHVRKLSLLLILT
jgi:hypothetical protein